MAKKWVDLTDEFTPEGYAEIMERKSGAKHGLIMTFAFEGSRTQFKFISRRGGRIWGLETRTYTTEEVEAMQAIHDSKKMNRAQRRFAKKKGAI